MLNSVLSILVTALSAASNILNQILNGTGTRDLILALIFLLLASRFLLQPIFGSRSRGSDKAKKKGDYNE